MMVKIASALKYPWYVDDSCRAIDVIDSSVEEHYGELLCEDKLKLSLTKGAERCVTDPRVGALIKQLDSTQEITPLRGFEDLKKDDEMRLKSSIEEPLTLELKQLLSYLE